MSSLSSWFSHGGRWKIVSAHSREGRVHKKLLESAQPRPHPSPTHKHTVIYKMQKNSFHFVVLLKLLWKYRLPLPSVTASPTASLEGLSHGACTGSPGRRGSSWWALSRPMPRAAQNGLHESTTLEQNRQQAASRAVKTRLAQSFISAFHPCMTFCLLKIFKAQCVKCSKRRHHAAWLTSPRERDFEGRL